MNSKSRWSSTCLSTCLTCGANLDGAIGVDTQKQPSPGDITMCVYCGEIYMFREDLSLELVSLKKLLQLTPLQQQLVEHAQYLVRMERLDTPKRSDSFKKDEKRTITSKSFRSSERNRKAL